MNFQNYYFLFIYFRLVVMHFQQHMYPENGQDLWILNTVPDWSFVIQTRKGQAVQQPPVVWNVSPWRWLFFPFFHFFIFFYKFWCTYIFLNLRTRLWCNWIMTPWARLGASFQTCLTVITDHFQLQVRFNRLYICLLQPRIISFSVVNTTKKLSLFLAF